MIVQAVDHRHRVAGMVGDVDGIGRGVDGNSIGAAPHRDRGSDRVGRSVDHRHRVAVDVGDVDGVS